jgi:hypothetical protein
MVRAWRASGRFRKPQPPRHIAGLIRHRISKVVDKTRRPGVLELAIVFSTLDMALRLQHYSRGDT